MGGGGRRRQRFALLEGAEAALSRDSHWALFEKRSIEVCTTRLVDPFSAEGGEGAAAAIGCRRVKQFSKSAWLVVGVATVYHEGAYSRCDGIGRLGCQSPTALLG